MRGASMVKLLGMKVNTDKKIVDEILDRGVITTFLPSKEKFREKLLSGEKIKLYIGADPTSKSLHLSHAKNYMLLEEFRKLGHEVIVLFGDFTARIGDPSDNSNVRSQLTEKDVKENVKEWSKQIKPLLDFSDKKNPPKIVFNSTWLSKLTLEEIIELASNFTVQHMLERDMFEKRIKNNNPIFLHEFLYPLMQGYDSVVLEVDAELSGTDQIFNSLAGRTLLKRLKGKEKFVVAVNLMENPKTGELMSKSRGTGVFLESFPSEMYGEIMAQPDEMIEILFINTTRVPLDEIKDMDIKNNPLESKKRAAYEIVKIIHGEKNAEKAEEEFSNIFQKKKIPDAIKEVTAVSGEKLVDILTKEGLIKSKSEFRRLVDQGAVSDLETKTKIADSSAIIESDIILKIGKKHFLKIKVV